MMSTFLLLVVCLAMTSIVVPEDSITIAISPDESIEFIRYVKEPDSTYAVPCRHAYEEQAQCRTLVYWWVNEMPQFAEGKLREDDKEAFCRYVHSCGIYDDVTDCSANVAYDAVIERDGSVSNLRRTRGDGDTAFYSRVERMLLDMPKWKPGLHDSVAKRVDVYFNIYHPDSCGKTEFLFLGKPRTITVERPEPRPDKPIIKKIPKSDYMNQRTGISFPRLQLNTKRK